MLQKAGFSHVGEETKSLPWTWPGTAEEVWQQAQAVERHFFLCCSGFQQERDEVDHEVIAAIQHYTDGNSIKFGALVVLASGTKSDSIPKASA